MKRTKLQWSSREIHLTLCCCFIIFGGGGGGGGLGTSLLVSGAQPYFVAEPESEFLRQGLTVRLDCTAEPSNAGIRWLFNGSLITTKRGNAVTGGRLILGSSSKWEQGLYQCLANNSDGAALSSAVYVAKAYLDGFEEGLSDRDIEVVINNTAVIPCATPKGVPSTVTEFEKNSTKLILTSRHRLLPSGNLQISHVEAADEGIYRCIAINPITEERISAPNVVKLTVFEPVNTSQPQFTWTPQSHMEVVRGQNLTLECVAEGWPVPQMTWKRYGGVLPEGRSTTILGNLVINNVQKQDEGTYICRAEVNNTQPRENVAFIDVLEPPTITVPPSDQNVTESETAVFTCLASGSQKISITWFHNALLVTASQQVTISNGSMTLHGVRYRQNGVYQCFATNSIGMVYASARLIVNKNDEKMEVDVGFPNQVQNVAPNGLRKGKKIPKSSIGQARPTQTPAPIANDPGTETSEAERRATLLPPSKPVVSKTTETAALLSWTVTQNGSLPVVFFKIQYKENADNKKSQWKTLDDEISPDSRSYEVLDLKSGATYQFRIAAVYSNHDNKNSPISDRFVLKAGSLSSGRSKAPISSPSIVDVRANMTSFIVVWQYQPQRRVTIDGFNIYYKPYDSDSKYLSIKVPGSNIRNTTISGLQPDTSYSLRITCFNAEGESNSSMSVVGETLGSFESSQTPAYREEEFIEPSRTPHSTSATVVHAVYDNNRVNTHASNELLFIVLGVVLGIMMLILCIVMVMCALKQRQQQRLMAALEGRRKFHDPSKTIYVGSQMKSASEGSFLLNGVGVPNRKTTSNGYLCSRGNGSIPTGTNSKLTSEYELKSSTDSRNKEENVPLRNQTSCEYDDKEDGRGVHTISCSDLKQIGHYPSREEPFVEDYHLPQPVDANAAIYPSPDDLPAISRPKDVPFQQLSLKSSRSSCDYRLHNNDCLESYPSSQTNTSPDHIPRLYECQLLYRSPEHTRRSRDHSRGRSEQVSDQSLSASSQVSSGHLKPLRHVNYASIEPETDSTACSKTTNAMLPAETDCSDAENQKDPVSSYTSESKTAESIPVPIELSHKKLSSSPDVSSENSEPNQIMDPELSDNNKSHSDC